MIYPLVCDLAAAGIAVAVACRVLGFSTQAFYAWKKNPVTQRDWDDAHLINAALDIHGGAPEFGYRLLADELPGHGITASENRVARLCSLQRIFSAHSKKRGLNRKAGPPVHGDLRGRDFTAQGPNVKWLTGITEHWNPSRRGQALPVRDQGRLLQPDCGLRHRRAHESRPRGPGAAERDRAAQPGRNDRPFGQRVPISF